MYSFTPKIRCLGFIQLKISTPFFPAQSVRLFLRTLLGFIIKAFDENCGARFCRVFFFALVFFFLGTFFPHAQLVTNFPRKQIR